MHLASTSRLRRPDVGAVAAASAVSTVGVLPVFLLGAIAVLVRDDLGFDEARLGVAVSLFWTAAALCSIPSGRIAERLGGRGALAMAAGGSALSLFVAAVAGTWWVLVVGLLIGGTANALSQLAANLRLTDAIWVGRQGLAFGLKQAAVPAATLVGGIAVPAVAIPLGWRWAFAAAAGGALALGLLQMREMQRTDQRRTAGLTRAAMAHAPLIVLGAAGAFGAASANAMAAFLVEYCVAIGLRPAAAGLVLAVGSAAAIGARVLMGWLADRRSGGNLLVIAAMLAVGGVVVAAFPLVSSLAAVVVVTVVAYAIGWGWPGLFHFTVVRRNPHAPAAATGVTQAGVYVGGVGGPLVFGLAVEHLGYVTAWRGAAASLLTAAGLMLVGRILARRAWPSTLDTVQR